MSLGLVVVLGTFVFLLRSQILFALNATVYTENVPPTTNLSIQLYEEGQCMLVSKSHDTACLWRINQFPKSFTLMYGVKRILSSLIG